MVNFVGFVVKRIADTSVLPVRSYTSVPVCKVLSWSCDALNPVGSEYIVMEKAKGRQLVEVWGEMNQPQKFKLIQNLVRLESQLASMKFSGYGNLYFRHSVRHVGRVIPIDDVYCIGPAYNESWFPQSHNRNHTGPCVSSIPQDADPMLIFIT